MLTVEELMNRLSLLDNQTGVMVRYLPEGSSIPVIAHAKRVIEAKHEKQVLPILKEEQGLDFPGLIVIDTVPEREPEGDEALYSGGKGL